MISDGWVQGRWQMTERIESFRDLKVYQETFKLQQEIYAITKSFPKEEMYSLTDQIRRSSRSIGANLAEAWQKRRYEANFISKLTDADAELSETQHWLDTALSCNYIDSVLHHDLLQKCQHIGRMLGAIMKNPTPFSRQYPK